MFSRIGATAVARPRLILALAIVGVAVAAFFGIKAPGVLGSGGFVSPNAPSQLATNKLNSEFHGGGPNLIFVVTARSGGVDSPQVAAAGVALTHGLADSYGVAHVISYWNTGNSGLRSTGGTQALIEARVRSGSAKHLISEFSVGKSKPGPVTVDASGSQGVNQAINSQIGKDLALAEGVAIPLTLLLLIFAFGSVVSALLPVLIGTIAIMGTLAVLYVLGSITSVSIYSLNLTTAMGLGLSIDYALLVVNRYREELGRGATTAEAVVRSVRSAGRTVSFSATTVAAAMAVLLVFPVAFLRSFAYAGISVVIVATVSALLVLPAMLALLGPRVNALSVRTVNAKPESALWKRVATGVMRRPLLAGLPVIVLLVVLGAPFLNVHFGTPDDRVLPTSSPARQGGDSLRTNFPASAYNTIEVVTTAALTPTDQAAYSSELSALSGVAALTGPEGTWATGVQVLGPSAANGRYQAPGGDWFSLDITPNYLSAAAENLVHQVRALPPPGGARSYVGGQAAGLVDQKHDLSERLPLAIALVALTTFLVLFGFTGSVVLPLKALVLSGLTLVAVLGAMVWVFQDGNLASVFGFTPGPLSTVMPLLLFCVAFGLSMDYEVFLLSRIKEQHEAGASNEESVVIGLSRTGRIVTTAAALLAVSFFALCLSKVSFIQFFGLGTGLAILIDATLVRGVLVPAFMRIAGEANWWAPKPLRNLQKRFGPREASPSLVDS